MSTAIKSTVGLQGRYKMEVLKNNEVTSSISFKNIITDWGMDRLAATTGYGASSGMLYNCSVGTGNTSPNVADLLLVNRLASVGVESSDSINQGAPDYVMLLRKTYLFPLGAVVGNVAEVGVGDFAGGNLFSRALVVDTDGFPTTVTVLADEQLRVTYELSVYPFLGDVTGNVLIGETNHTYTIRARGIGGSAGPWVPNTAYNFSHSQSTAIYGVGSVLGPITGTPTGGQTSLGFGSAGTLGYVPGSWKRGAYVTMSLAAGNIGGITCILYTGDNGFGNWQMHFNPPIPKDGTKTLGVSMEVAWTRV